MSIIKKQLILLTEPEKDDLIQGLLGILTCDENFDELLLNVKANIQHASPDAQPRIKQALDFIDESVSLIIKSYLEGN